MEVVFLDGLEVIGGEVAGLVVEEAVDKKRVEVRVKKGFMMVVDEIGVVVVEEGVEVMEEVVKVVMGEGGDEVEVVVEAIDESSSPSVVEIEI